MSSSQFRRSKRRIDDDEPTFLKRDRHRRRLPPADFGSETFGVPEGDRWSTWDQSAPTERGPQPHPGWLVTDLAAVDTELGILKPGKEADVGYAHGDLSAYNLLVHGGRLVMIDMPQIVDMIANPRGADFLTRDSANVARWFTARGLTGVTPAPADLAGLLLAEARLS